MDDYDYFPIRYEPPQRINLFYDKYRHIPVFFYHAIAGLFWLVIREWTEIKVEQKPETYGWRWTRKKSNEKLRKHGTYFENETTVTDFKYKLDEED